MKLPIYMDNHATTPLDPRVLEAMMPYLTTEYGNAASQSHPYGWKAEKAVENARAQIASLIGADPKEIVFTSGATESNNLAIKGVYETHSEKGKHLITQPTEHKAVLDPVRYLERKGAKVTMLKTDVNGLINLDELKNAAVAETLLASIMFANNEIGTIQPIAEIGAIAREKGFLLHVDAAQAAGRIPIHVERMNIHLLSLSAHKLYGPKGIGALYVRSKNPRASLAAQIHGGGHENGMRSGTLNVPGIVGFGKACEIAAAEMESESKRIEALRDHLYEGLVKAVDGINLNGHPSKRLGGNLSVSFPGVQSDQLLMALNHDVAISAGSACTSKIPEPSHVLKALGLSGERILTSVRFGIGRFNTAQEIEEVIVKVIAAVKKIRQMPPFSPRLESPGAAFPAN